MKKKRWFYLIGIMLILLSITMAILAYAPVVYKRLAYKEKSSPAFPIKLLKGSNQSKKAIAIEPVNPVSTEFGLVIPKISINVPVTKNVDGTIPKEYFEKLKFGVGHYKGTPLPDETGNTVIFGHSSSVPGVKSTDYAEAFLLIDKLSSKDTIELYYQKNKQVYEVITVKEVAAEDIDVLKNSKEKQLTLITCWPPGTSIKRMVVVAKLII